MKGNGKKELLEKKNQMRFLKILKIEQYDPAIPTSGYISKQNEKRI